jgi:hypothetical protein
VYGGSDRSEFPMGLKPLKHYFNDHVIINSGGLHRFRFNVAAEDFSDYLKTIASAERLNIDSFS